MAGNDWINSYLEAILDVDTGIDDHRSSLLLRERGRFSPAQYFVEEVITGFNETDLHRSWASSIRNSEERNTRLENMCWRIWTLARRKKQIEGEEAQRRAKRHLEREKARREATADMSEDLSEGEKGDIVGDISAHADAAKGRMQRVSSVDMMANLVTQNKDKKLYLVLISLHGLIRGENMELGRDSDTGGQVKYVVELARALGSMPGVYRVDLLTRQVLAPDVDWTYGEPTEMLNPLNPENDMNETGESGEFVDGALGHILQMSKVLGKQIGTEQPLWPIAIHGHYADAGNSAALLSGALNVPMIFTGHSLGRDKLEQLLKQGRQSREEINSTYKIMRRIEAEEMTLDDAEVIITSTRQEIEEQWRLYDGFDPVLERKLRARIKRNVSCYGRFMPRMVVIPPGMEFRNVVPNDGDIDGEAEGNGDGSGTPDPPIWSEIMRFFTNPRKPMILALARPDPKKNLITLVKAFGECRPLRDLANLTLIMGNRDAIDDMSTTNSSVLLSILKLIDKYDLYGHVAYPKHHKQSDVPDIYRLAAKTKAAARGLPIVATKNGGPVDIHRVLDNGVLVDPHNQQSIADALRKLVADKQLWARYIQDLSLSLKISLDGERNDVTSVLKGQETAADQKNQVKSAPLKLAANESMEKPENCRFPALRMRKFILYIAVDSDSIADILGISKIIVEAAGRTEKDPQSIGFILSTSWSMSEINGLLEKAGLKSSYFDAFICNSGSEIYYPSPSPGQNSSESQYMVDSDYQSHIHYRWGGESLRNTLVRWAASVNDDMKDKREPVITELDSGSSHCYEFRVQDAALVPPFKELRKLMRIQALRCHAVYCKNGERINVIPVLASRAQALRYLHVRWGIDISNVVFFVGECGDSDYEALLGGLHKTVILKGQCNGASKIHTNRSYPLEHVVPTDDPKTVQCEECDTDGIKATLEKLGVVKV
ncbi:UNVERIFIED_CONTAM: putative sucrose-phosphate synthase 1 [Sesamum radiatum]|uniref:sucrose-phosphate synthase n=1 Tax=Sesamum radiatum TaxID=300843 RepID=A0AAW2JS99_SESRA